MLLSLVQSILTIFSPFDFCFCLRLRLRFIFLQSCLFLFFSLSSISSFNFSRTPLFLLPLSSSHIFSFAPSLFEFHSLFVSHSPSSTLPPHRNFVSFSHFLYCTLSSAPSLSYFSSFLYLTCSLASSSL